MSQATDGWELAWSDDFDGGSLDETRWSVTETGDVADEEQQAYAADEVWVEDGCLVLRSRRRRWPGGGVTRDFTSGKVVTRAPVGVGAGRVEVRAKLPTGRGLWPAHWLLPVDGSWPPAIVLTEVLGDDPHTVHMTTETGRDPDVLFDRGSWTGPDLAAGFHTYAVEWTRDGVRYLVDGELRHATGPGRGGLDAPFSLVLNTAVGGRWPYGRPGPGDPDESTRFPQVHLVDRVDVYRRSGNEGRRGSASG